jgi:hypothetical protein
MGLLGTTLAFVCGFVLHTVLVEDASPMPPVYTTYVSYEPYLDTQLDVWHPPTVRSFVHELMVLGAGPHTLTNGKASNSVSPQVSIAMYIEPTLAKTQLDMFRGFSALELRSVTVDTDRSPAKQTKRKFVPATFYAGLGSGQFDRAIRIQIEEPLPSHLLLESLSAQLEPFLSSVDAQEREALKEEFKAMFDDIADTVLQTGDELLFSVTQQLGSDYFTLSVNGDLNPLDEPLRMVTDQPILTDAFFNVFLDQTSLSDRFTDRAPLLWSAGFMNFQLVTAGRQDQWPKMSKDTPEWAQLQMFEEQIGATTRLAGMTTLQAGSMPWSGELAEVSLYVDYELYDENVPRDLDDRILYLLCNDIGHTFGLGLRIGMDITASDLVNRLLEGMDLEFWTDEIIGANRAKAEKIFRNLFPFFLNKGDRLMMMRDSSWRLVMFVNGKPWNMTTECSRILWSALFRAILDEPSIFKNNHRYSLVKFFQPVESRRPGPTEPWYSY